jgi:hypothetical protein
LQTRGSELCQAIVGPPMVWGHLLKGIRIAASCYVEMVGQLVKLYEAVSSTMQSMLGHSPAEAFRVDVVEEMLDEF